jgi:hypothetical protein
MLQAISLGKIGGGGQPIKRRGAIRIAPMGRVGKAKLGCILPIADGLASERSNFGLRLG